MPIVIFEAVAKFLKTFAQVHVASFLHWLELLSFVDKVSRVVVDIFYVMLEVGETSITGIIINDYDDSDS